MSSGEGFRTARQYPLWDAIFGRRSRRVAAGAAFRSGTLSFQSALAPQPLSRLEEAFLISRDRRHGAAVRGQSVRDGRRQAASGHSVPGGHGSSRWQSRQRPEHGLLHVERRGHLHAQAARRPGCPRGYAHDVGRRSRRSRRAMQGQDQGRPHSISRGGSRRTPAATDTCRTCRAARCSCRSPRSRGNTSTACFTCSHRNPGSVRCSWTTSTTTCRAAASGGSSRSFSTRRSPSRCSFYAKGRTEYESMLLLQNLALVAQSMGLGGWIHAAFETSILLGGYPDIGPGLGFRFETAEEAARLPRPYPAAAPNPVGLDGVLQSYAPPYFKDTDAAIDAILAEKYGPSGLYRDGATAAPSMKPDVGGGVRARSAACRAGSRRGRACHLPVHLEDVRSVSCALPRHRFGRHLDAVPSHRP